jgi:hypothetical protein
MYAEFEDFVILIVVAIISRMVLSILPQEYEPEGIIPRVEVVLDVIGWV